MYLGQVASDSDQASDPSLYSQTAVPANSSSGTTSGTGSFAAAFSEAFSDASTATTQAASAASSDADSTQNSTLDWTTIATGVSTATGPDGTKWMKIDESQVLTADDKRITGWTSGSSTMDVAASLVAQDRADGTLTGPITADYVLGNKAKGIAGLADRGPAISQQDAEAMAKLVSA